MKRLEKGAFIWAPTAVRGPHQRRLGTQSGEKSRVILLFRGRNGGLQCSWCAEPRRSLAMRMNVGAERAVVFDALVRQLRPRGLYARKDHSRPSSVSPVPENRDLSRRGLFLTLVSSAMTVLRSSIRSWGQ